MCLTPVQGLDGLICGFEGAFFLKAGDDGRKLPGLWALCDDGVGAGPSGRLLGGCVRGPVVAIN